MVSDSNSWEDQKGLKRILFDRTFGGAVSLLLKNGVDRHKKGGMIYAECSQSLSSFCGGRCDEASISTGGVVATGGRTITLTFVPEGEPVRALERQALGDSQWKNDSDGMGALEAAMAQAAVIGDEIKPGLDPGELPRSRCCIVGFKNVVDLNMHIFFTYLSPEHGAHQDFRNMQGKKDTLTIDWDFHQPDQMQCLLRRAIGPKFFNSCSLAWQEKKKAKAPSLWPGGALTPPLALGLMLQKIPKPVDRLV
jgi:hypothetical protein